MMDEVLNVGDVVREYLRGKVKQVTPELTFKGDDDVASGIRAHLDEIARVQARQRNEEREQQIRQAIDRYLVELPSSSWGSFFTITDPDRRAQAVDYIYKVFEGVDRRLQDGAR